MSGAAEEDVLSLSLLSYFLTLPIYVAQECNCSVKQCLTCPNIRFKKIL